MRQGFQHEDVLIHEPTQTFDLNAEDSTEDSTPDEPDENGNDPCDSENANGSPCRFTMPALVGDDSESQHSVAEANIEHDTTDSEGETLIQHLRRHLFETTAPRHHRSERTRHTRAHSSHQQPISSSDGADEKSDALSFPRPAVPWLKVDPIASRLLPSAWTPRLNIPRTTVQHQRLRFRNLKKSGLIARPTRHGSTAVLAQTQRNKIYNTRSNGSAGTRFTARCPKPPRTATWPASRRHPMRPTHMVVAARLRTTTSMEASPTKMSSANLAITSNMLTQFPAINMLTNLPADRMSAQLPSKAFQHRRARRRPSEAC